jgi:hypothetical protein
VKKYDKNHTQKIFYNKESWAGKFYQVVGFIATWYLIIKLIAWL